MASNPLSVLMPIKTLNPEVDDYWLSVPATVKTIDGLKLHVLTNEAIDTDINVLDLHLYKSNGILRGQSSIAGVIRDKDRIEMRIKCKCVAKRSKTTPTVTRPTPVARDGQTPRSPLTPAAIDSQSLSLLHDFYKTLSKQIQSLTASQRETLVIKDRDGLAAQLTNKDNELKRQTKSMSQELETERQRCHQLQQQIQSLIADKTSAIKDRDLLFAQIGDKDNEMRRQLEILSVDYESQRQRCVELQQQIQLMDTNKSMAIKEWHKMVAQLADKDNELKNMAREMKTERNRCYHLQQQIQSLTADKTLAIKEKDKMAAELAQFKNKAALAQNVAQDVKRPFGYDEFIKKLRTLSTDRSRTPVSPLARLSIPGTPGHRFGADPSAQTLCPEVDDYWLSISPSLKTIDGLKRQILTDNCIVKDMDDVQLYLYNGLLRGNASIGDVLQNRDCIELRVKFADTKRISSLVDNNFGRHKRIKSSSIDCITVDNSDDESMSSRSGVQIIVKTESGSMSSPKVVIKSEVMSETEDTESVDKSMNVCEDNVKQEVIVKSESNISSAAVVSDAEAAHQWLPYSQPCGTCDYLGCEGQACGVAPSDGNDMAIEWLECRSRCGLAFKSRALLAKHHLNSHPRAFPDIPRIKCQHMG
ncbi:unnamed protein product [Medioppia subpectinata]|uniref:C2H2-type domain-containing protein n=1 Tax=Medioppia subpectinata TaxID=1979941 RepID=A0A7R9PTZ9_9ACAR|nr:unnamed protein product [Medioppia subpectinata]CAG2101206.1 unnamed protein product [Medioppia subpectinata]